LRVSSVNAAPIVATGLVEPRFYKNLALRGYERPNPFQNEPDLAIGLPIKLNDGDITRSTRVPLNILLTRPRNRSRNLRGSNDDTTRDRRVWNFRTSDGGAKSPRSELVRHQAHAYASVRGSVPALMTPVLRSITIAASEPSDQEPVTRSL